MNELILRQQQSLCPEASRQALTRCNQLTAPYHLTLTEAQMERLAVRHREVLKKTKRVEFGVGILPKLIETFCDSPYLHPHSYEETLTELQTLFYQLKGVCREALTDEELLTAMRLVFDRVSHGDLTLLEGLDRETLLTIGRTGSLQGTPWEFEEDILNEY